MKKIEHYLPYYLGCEVLLESEMYGTNGVSDKIRETLVAYDIRERGVAEGKEHILYEGDFKLLLRPLSDMTEEEKIRVYLWEYPNYKSGELIKNDSDTDFFVVKNENGLKCYVNQHHFSAETTRKLLKVGFDLFGLIEAGLALDKTKQNPDK